jgi:superfamily II DNA or RNA helicase
MNAGNATNYAARTGQDPKDVIKWATQGLRNIHKRKDMIDNAERKIDVAEKLIKRFGVRTMTFSQSTTFTLELAKRLGKDATQYHTKIDSDDIYVSKSKSYRTGKGALSAKRRLAKKGYKYVRSSMKDGQWFVSWRQPRRMSGKAIAEKNIQDFIDGKYLYLLSAKALDQGTDIPDVQLGVETSRSESKTQRTQRTGRIARTFIVNGKPLTKIYVNLYIPDWSVPDSKDTQKLKASQADSRDPLEVDDVEELIEVLEKVIEKRASS